MGRFFHDLVLLFSASEWDVVLFPIVALLVIFLTVKKMLQFRSISRRTGSLAEEYRECNAAAARRKALELDRSLSNHLVWFLLLALWQSARILLGMFYTGYVIASFVSVTSPAQVSHVLPNLRYFFASMFFTSAALVLSVLPFVVFSHWKHEICSRTESNMLSRLTVPSNDR